MPIKRLDHINFITHDMPETIAFYCNVIGLIHGEHLSIDTAQSIYFYIPGESIAILHIGNAKASKKQPQFERYANLDEHQQGEFSTGAFDHFCLALDSTDYDGFIEKLNLRKLSFQTWCHDNVRLKQIWILDPNGVRVELNFI
jgi:catechol 2,3-dioxygenase-like lactoylglutathione lyase family enzyme